MLNTDSIDISFIHRILRWLANGITNDYVCNRLSPALTNKMNKFYTTLQTTFDWEKLTREDCRALGFMCYGADENEEYEVWCIPAWLYPIIPEGLNVTDNDFTTFQFKRVERPFKVTYGVLEYGLIFKNPTYGKSLEELIEELSDDN